jgi:hypothetical protein
MSVHTSTPDMVRWTCGATTDTSSTGSATFSWGMTALSKRPKKAQHFWPWANGFISAELTTNNDQVVFGKGCDRDEWPPRYFWPGDVEAAKKGMVQRIRMLPYDQNRGAGQVWAGVCLKYGAQSVARSTSYIQSAYISTIGPHPEPQRVEGKDGTISTLR